MIEIDNIYNMDCIEGMKLMANDRLTFTSSSSMRMLVMFPFTRPDEKPLMVAYRYDPRLTTHSLISTSSSRRNRTREPSTALMSSQWGMQAATNAYQKTSNAIGKAIKKNKVKLKYGTFVYLVNGREKQ